jgi:DNA-binding protein YbaB
LTNETLQVVSNDMQKRIIEVIQQELNQKEIENTTGKDRVKITRKRLMILKSKLIET